MRRPFVPRAVLNEELVEPLVRRTLAHDPVTWPRVWLEISPVIEEVAGHWRVTSRLADRDDERRDIVVGVMARLCANDFERLALFHEVLLRRDGLARAWLVQVTTRSAIGHLRGHPENIGDDEWRWVEMEPLSDGDEELPVFHAGRADARGAPRLGVRRARARPDSSERRSAGGSSATKRARSPPCSGSPAPPRSRAFSATPSSACAAASAPDEKNRPVRGTNRRKNASSIP